MEKGFFLIFLFLSILGFLIGVLVCNIIQFEKRFKHKNKRIKEKQKFWWEK
jgi:hypothetical protein